MPRIDTETFGPLDYAPDSVLEFPAGLPAFEDQTRFVIIEQPEAAPVVFLQSLLRPDLAFLTLPVQAIATGYRLEIPPEDGALLGFQDDRPRWAPAGGLLCLAVVTAPPDAEPTANLMAPVVVNLDTRRGAQVVRADWDYSHQHPLFVPRKEAECS